MIRTSIIRPTIRAFVVGCLLSAAPGMAAECKINPLAENALNEQGLRSFVEQFGKQNLSIDEFACCLPKVFKQNHLVVHSSVAQQDSIPESPRVILTNFSFNDSGESKPPTAFFSINGGHSSLRQTKSYEVAFVNPQTGKVELFDINFSNRFPTVEGPNPPLCLACHGTNGQHGVSGPRLIFDGPDVWPRFVNGVDFLAPVTAAPTPVWLQTYLKRLGDASKKDLDTNPRFQCISKTVPTVGFQNELDHMIAKLNRLRVVQEIRGTKDYETYKFAIAASEICPNMIYDVDCQLHKRAQPSSNDSSCKNWFSAAAVREMNRENLLSSWIQGVSDSERLNQLANVRLAGKKNDIRKEVEKSNRSNSLERMNFNFRSKLFRDKTQMPDKRLTKLKSLILRKYVVDLEDHGSTVIPMTRFLFESRGIPIGSWSTDVVAGYQRQAVGLSELIKGEPAHGGLRSLLNSSGETCEALRLASLGATSDPPLNTPVRNNGSRVAK